jgi:hypothetical protein
MAGVSYCKIPKRLLTCICSPAEQPELLRPSAYGQPNKIFLLASGNFNSALAFLFGARAVSMTFWNHTQIRKIKLDFASNSLCHIWKSDTQTPSHNTCYFLIDKSAACFHQ